MYIRIFRKIMKWKPSREVLENFEMIREILLIFNFKYFKFHQDKRRWDFSYTMSYSLLQYILFKNLKNQLNIVKLLLVAEAI